MCCSMMGSKDCLIVLLRWAAVRSKHALTVVVMHVGVVGVMRRWKLVTILPGQVWGPPLSVRHKNAESVKMLVSMLSGFFFPAAPPIGAACIPAFIHACIPPCIHPCIHASLPASCLHACMHECTALSRMSHKDLSHP